MINYINLIIVFIVLTVIKEKNYTNGMSKQRLNYNKRIMYWQ